MYIIKVTIPGEGVLTYLFSEESYGKTGNDKLGISTIISAMTKQFENHKEIVTMTVMKDTGYYYSHRTNTYEWPKWDGSNWKDIQIPLNKLAQEHLS